MALTPTTQIPLGFTAPDFSLPEPLAENALRSLQDLRGEKATVVVFICNHCPYVIHVMEEIVRVAKEYEAKGVKFIAINSNDVENYPEDSPEKMVAFSKKYSFNFPYLYDESQEVARAYDAACTPDFNVFDADMLCQYRGQLDGARPGSDAPNDGADLRKALDCIVLGQSLPSPQIPSTGCNIKWKK